VTIINWKLISHPMNWLTVLVILIIAGTAGHLLASWMGLEPATKGKLAYSQMPAGQSPGEPAAGAIPPQYSPLPMY
jgi:hypothetical protein